MLVNVVVMTSKGKRGKQGDYGSQMRLSQHAVVADRKNRVENVRHAISDRILERQQLRSRFLMDKEQRYVINTLNVMKRSSGNSSLAQAPDGPNDRSYLNAHILQGSGHMTEKRLMQWRAEEHDLQQQMRSSLHQTVKQNVATMPSDEEEQLQKQIMELMVSIGYTYADVQKIVAALKRGKRDTNDDKVINNEDDDLVAEEVDVFESLRAQLRPDSKIAFRLPANYNKGSAPFDFNQWQRIVCKLYASQAIGEKTAVKQPSRPTSPTNTRSGVKFNNKKNVKRVSNSAKHGTINEEDELDMYKPRSSMTIVERYGGQKIRPQTGGYSRHQLAEIKSRLRSKSVTELTTEAPQVLIDKPPEYEQHHLNNDGDQEGLKNTSAGQLLQDNPGVDREDIQSVDTALRTENDELTIKDYSITDNSQHESEEDKLLDTQHEDYIPEWFKRRRSSTADSEGKRAPVKPQRRMSRWQKDLLREAPPGVNTYNKPIKVILGRSKSQRDNDLKDLVQKNLLREQMEGILSGQHNRDVQARVKLVKSVMKIEHQFA